MSEITLRWAVHRDVRKLKALDSEIPKDVKKIDCPMLIAEDGQRPIGYLAYTHTSDSYELLRLYVSPKYRNTGVGSSLLKLLLFKVRGPIHPMKRLSVECFIEKKDSKEGLDKINFFRKMGFMLVGYDEDIAILQYDHPTEAVARIVSSNRLVPWLGEEVLSDN